jgi:hypothetical protein
MQPTIHVPIDSLVFILLIIPHNVFDPLFHPVSNFNTLRHQFESGKTQKTAGRRLSVAIGNTKVTIVQIAITIIQVLEMFYSKLDLNTN